MRDSDRPSRLVAPRTGSFLRTTPIKTLVLFGTFIVLGLSGVFAHGSSNALNATSVLDVMVLIVILMSTLRLRRDWSTWAFIIGLSVWIVGRFAWSLGHSPASLADLVQSHKWIVFLIAILLCAGAPDIMSGLGPRLTKVLLLLFLVKYLASYLFRNGSQWNRPSVFAENNFELFLLLGLVAIFYFELGDRMTDWLVCLFIVVVLSGSRSGAIGLLVVFTYLANERVHRELPVFSTWVLIALGALGGVATFLGRSVGGFDSIDRVEFFDVFRYEVSGWGLPQWLLGSQPITPLSPQSCERMGYWNTLFSRSGDGNCYSVILHLFVLRIVFDFGLFGVLIVVVALRHSFRCGNVPARLSWTLGALAVVNALSVSSLNSVYVAFPIMLSVMSRGQGQGQGWGQPPAARAVRCQVDGMQSRLGMVCTSPN